MATAKLPRQPKHGRDWTRDKPTVGAVILFLLIGIGLGIQSLISGFANADVNAKIRDDEQCQAQIQNQTLNRNRILSDLNARDKAALNRYIYRVSNDVLRSNIADIPRAYEAYRQDVEANDEARAEQGAVLSATALPSNCRLKLTEVTPLELPPIGSTSGRPSSTSLPPLSTETSTFTARATVTRTVSDTFTMVVPGPVRTRTVTVTQHGRPPATRTVTVTVPRATVTVPRATRTVTVTVTPTP